MYQRSLDTGRVAADWLKANILAAFKKGARHEAENYKPISLTDVPCKILDSYHLPSYEPVPKVHHKNGTVQAENEYGRLIKLSIFLSVA